jgi:hypothetical protein
MHVQETTAPPVVDEDYYASVVSLIKTIYLYFIYKIFLAEEWLKFSGIINYHLK